MTQKRAVVLGTGAWGTTFAQVLADANMKVDIWGRREDVVEFINAGENTPYLPGIELPAAISATTSMREILHEGPAPDMVVIAVPTAAVGEVAAEAKVGDIETLVMSLSKGVEPETYRTVDQIISEEGGVDPQRLAVLSGPNLSREIAERQPAATVVASESWETARQLAIWCHNSYFRPYVSTDVIGCEMAGATKNVIALAIGAADGMGLGTNTRSTLMTRGLAECTRLGIAMGARAETYSGLAGMGDLIATCSSKLSRNYSLGVRLGKGMTLAEAISLSPGVAEGARSARPILDLADSYGVEMPITAGAVAVLEGKATVAEMGEMLLERPQKADGWQIELLD